MVILKKLMVGILGLMLFLPWIQRSGELFSLRPLNGDFVPAPKPEFTVKNWKEGVFQAQSEKYTEEKIGFHALLVRLKNQQDYSIFKMANAEGVVVGKHGELYEQDYIRAYLGGDFIGESTIEKKFRRLRFVQEKLKAMGKDLVLLFEPGRASFSPENIPDQYYKLYPKQKSNYSCMLENIHKFGIRYIDFNKYFVETKNKSPYPLYPKQGVHWSEYGSFLVADSIKRYIEALRGIQLGKMTWTKPELSDSLRSTDYDAGKAMNLLFEIPHPKMAYPKLIFEDQPMDKRPSVLVISDSYYWNIFVAEIPMHLFKHGEFWYYNSLAQFDQEKAKDVKTLNLQKEIAAKDVIMVMVTERFLFNYDWRFIDNLYEMFTPELQIDEPYKYTNNIRGVSDWFTMMIKKAKDSRISLEEAVRRDAMYVFENENKDLYMLFAGLDHYYVGMKADENWLGTIAGKASKKGITTAQQMKLDAEYMFLTEHPKVFEKYQKIQELMLKISNSPSNMELIRKNPYYLKPEEILWQEAYARSEGRAILNLTGF